MESATMSADLYAALGVSADATSAEIRTAYRQLVRRIHPDRGGDPAEFVAAARAYEVLRDPAARAEFDRSRGGDAAERQAGQRGDPTPRTSAGPSKTAGYGEDDRVGVLSGVVLDHLTWYWRVIQLPDEAVLRPGRARVAVVITAWVVQVAWIAAGLWIPAWRALHGVDGGAGIQEILDVVWIVCWVVVMLFATFAVIGRHVPISLAFVLLLAWPAYVHPHLGWSWIVYGWLVACVVLPLTRRRLARPMLSSARARDADVWTTGDGDTPEAEAIEVLTLIPGARVIHGHPAAAHLVVLGRKVACIAPAPGNDRLKAPGCRMQSWPGVGQNVTLLVDQVGQWLLDDNDPQVVDRRVLAMFLN